jgi:hypothetical protein
MALGLALGLTSPAGANTFNELQVANTGGQGWCITGDVNAVPGSAVFLYQCYRNINQGWYKFAYTQGGPVTFQYDYSYQGHPLCLADTGGSGSDGTQFEVWYCENAAFERFYVIDTQGLCQQYLVDGTSEALANNGGILADYNPVITWHAVFSATYERWFWLTC